MTGARVGVGVVTALFLLYAIFVGQRAVLLMLSGTGVGITMGIALIVLPIIGLWAVVREILFGAQASRLTRQLEDEEALPNVDLPRRASGRPERAAADAAFGEYRADAEAHPEDWRALFRLGLAYDDSGDRRRARRCLRDAIVLYRGGKASSTA